jgi:small subunit ribosomal protein S14
MKFFPFSMSKKALVEREHTRRRFFQKYYHLRLQYKKTFNHRNTFRERHRVSTIMQTLPRASIGTRINNRCKVSGRSRGYYRDFGLSRHFVRELVNRGVLPGIEKSSW